MIKNVCHHTFHGIQMAYETFNGRLGGSEILISHIYTLGGTVVDVIEIKFISTAKFRAFWFDYTEF